MANVHHFDQLFIGYCS